MSISVKFDRKNEDCITSESDADQRVGIIRVSMGLLAELLNFPPDHRIIDVRRRGDANFGEFDALCEGPTLPATRLDEMTPRADYLVRITESAKMVREKKFIGSFEVAAPQSTEDAA
jgi:hypothetical protein